MVESSVKRRKPSKVNKFEIILKESARLFCENGYEATSLDDVAEAVNIHKATLYHYIKGKEEILYLCLLRSFESYGQSLEAMKDQSVPPVERLRQFFTTLIEAQNNEFGRCLCLVGRDPLGTESGAKIYQFQRTMSFAVRDLIREGITDGSFKPCDPRIAANMIFGAFNSVPRWRKDKDVSTQDIARIYLDLFIGGLAADPSAGTTGSAPQRAKRPARISAEPPTAAADGTKPATRAGSTRKAAGDTKSSPTVARSRTTSRSKAASKS